MLAARPVYHAFDPNDWMFRHNIKISHGHMTSVSLARANDPSLTWMRAPYELYGGNQEKEAVFETVRVAEFDCCPPRLGSLYLFPTKEDADRANVKWWNNQRILLLAQVVHANRMGRFDSKQLDALQSDWEAAARRYWSGMETSEPLREVLVDGAIQLQGWEQYGHIGPPPRS
jgi:hypothetical protein